MRLKRAILLFFSCGLLFVFPEAQALEERVEDLSASVEVTSVFSLSLDNPNLAFGLITPGSSKILGEGRFFNEIRCRSNSGRTWYLKANLISLRLLEKEYFLPPGRLKWKIAESTGFNQPEGRMEFKEFSEQPVLIYTSQGSDNKGKEVALRLQYSLSSPADAPAGNYVGQIVFTMAESP